MHTCGMSELTFDALWNNVRSVEFSFQEHVSNDSNEFLLLHSQHHCSAADPTLLSCCNTLAVSMAVTAASPPLLPTLPPARSNAYRKHRQVSVYKRCICRTKCNSFSPATSCRCD